MKEVATKLTVPQAHRAFPKNIDLVCLSWAFL